MAAMSTTDVMLDNLNEAYNVLGFDANTSEDATPRQKADKVVAWITDTCKAKANNSSVIDYSHMPEVAKEVLRTFDASNDGKVSVMELHAAAQAYKRAQAHTSTLKRVVAGLLLSIVVLSGAMFAMTFLAAHLAKDTELHDIDVVGVSVMKSKGGDSVVATADSKMPLQLSSTLDDSQLAHLKTCSFKSDAGSSLYIRVDGFLRVPMVGSRCGNVVYMITQMGRIMLDDTDVSFENQASIDALNAMGFVSVRGGIGRRLSGAAMAEGFFDRIEASSSSFTCGSIPLPRAPSNYRARLITYQACDVPVPDMDVEPGKKHKVCQSEYGGYKMGSVGLSDELYRLTLAETSRDKELGDVDLKDLRRMEDIGRLGRKTEETVIDTTNYVFSASEVQHYFGHQLVTLREKSSNITFNFQLANPAIGLFNIGRKHCSNTTAGNSMSFEDMHIEYRGLWVEGGKSYRHWRMIGKKEAELIFNGSRSTEEINEYFGQKGYEYFDEPETLNPFRIRSGNGFVEYHNYASVTDSAVHEYLESMGVTVEDALAPSCSLQPGRGDTDVPRVMRNIEMNHNDVQMYKNAMETSPKAFERVGAGNFLSYLQRALDPFAAPDFCLQACNLNPQLYGDKSCPLTLEQFKCLVTSSESGFKICRWANLAQTAGKCYSMVPGVTRNANATYSTEVSTTNSSRRLFNRDSCYTVFGEYTVENFNMYLCLYSDNYWAYAQGWGCGNIWGAKVCGGGTLWADKYWNFGGRVEGSITYDYDIVTAIVRFEAGYEGSVWFWVEGSVEIDLWVAAVKAVLRGSYYESSGFRLDAEIFGSVFGCPYFTLIDVNII